MVNENKHWNGAVIIVKSTPLEEMKDWSADEKERMTEAVISNAKVKVTFKQPE